MTKNNLIEQVRELNDKRTQGLFWNDEFCGTIAILGQSPVAGWEVVSLIHPNLNFDTCPERIKAAMQFLGLSEEMAKLCLEQDLQLETLEQFSREQSRQLQIAREALECIAVEEYADEARERAKQALAQCEEG